MSHRSRTKADSPPPHNRSPPGIPFGRSGVSAERRHIPSAAPKKTFPPGPALTHFDQPDGPPDELILGANKCNRALMQTRPRSRALPPRRRLALSVSRPCSSVPPWRDPWLKRIAGTNRHKPAQTSISRHFSPEIWRPSPETGRNTNSTDSNAGHISPSSRITALRRAHAFCILNCPLPFHLSTLSYQLSTSPPLGNSFL
jgi:hypothetical protein